MTIVNDLKTLGKHTMIYGIGMMLGKALSFLLIPVYTRYLSPKDYGILELLDITGYVLGFLFGLGLDQGILKFYSQYDESQDKSGVLSTAIVFNLLLGGVLVLILLPLSQHFSQYILGAPDYTYLFILLFICLLLESVLAKGKTILRAQHRSVTFTIISLGYTVSAATLSVFFVVGLGLGLTGIYYSALICSFLFSTYLILNILKSTGVRVHWLKLKQMAAYGVPFVPVGIFAFILHWSDRYILNIYSNIETIGLYALGYKMGMSIVMLIAVPFLFIWNAYLFEIEKRPDAKQIYASIATYFVLAMTLGGLVLSVFSRELIAILAPKAYEDASRVIPIIAVAMIFMCSEDVFQVGLLIKGKSMYIALSKGIAAGVSVLFNIMLIPRYDMMGAAITVLVSMATFCAIIIHFSQKTYFIHFEYKRLGKIAAAALIVFSLTSLLNSENIWSSIILKTGMVALFPVVLVALGFLNFEETAILKRWHEQIRGHVWQN